MVKTDDHGPLAAWEEGKRYGCATIPTKPVVCPPPTIQNVVLGWSTAAGQGNSVSME